MGENKEFKVGDEDQETQSETVRTKKGVTVSSGITDMSFTIENSESNDPMRLKVRY